MGPRERKIKGRRHIQVRYTGKQKNHQWGPAPSGANYYFPRKDVRNWVFEKDWSWLKGQDRFELVS